MKYIYIISFLIILNSCSQENEINKSNLKYLALGDSYTIGENIAFEDAYPNQIVRELSLIDSVNVIAKTGWTTNELIDTLSKSYLDKYDVVSLLIGVNNQFRGYQIDKYVMEFENLLIRAIDYSKNKKNVFVLSIPDYGVTPFGKVRGEEKIYKEINSYNDINRALIIIFFTSFLLTHFFTFSISKTPFSISDLDRSKLNNCLALNFPLIIIGYSYSFSIK